MCLRIIKFKCQMVRLSVRLPVFSHTDTLWLSHMEWCKKIPDNQSEIERPLPKIGFAGQLLLAVIYIDRFGAQSVKIWSKNVQKSAFSVRISINFYFFFYFLSVLIWVGRQSNWLQIGVIVFNWAESQSNWLRMVCDRFYFLYIAVYIWIYGVIFASWNLDWII